jgi:hypothetical protein
VRRRVRGEPPQGLRPLPLLGDDAAATSLVGGDDDVHEPLEEVALLRRAGTPRGLERLVRLEELAAARELEAVLVGRPDGVSV